MRTIEKNHAVFNEALGFIAKNHSLNSPACNVFKGNIENARGHSAENTCIHAKRGTVFRPLGIKIKRPTAIAPARPYLKGYASPCNADRVRAVVFNVGRV